MLLWFSADNTQNPPTSEMVHPGNEHWYLILLRRREPFQHNLDHLLLPETHQYMIIRMNHFHHKTSISLTCLFIILSRINTRLSVFTWAFWKPWGQFSWCFSCPRRHFSKTNGHVISTFQLAKCKQKRNLSLSYFLLLIVNLTVSFMRLLRNLPDQILFAF